MNTRSASPADTAAPVLVWDAPVRVFHWLMVPCFALAYATAESERWRLLHVTLGYTMLGLVLFRLLWGVLGTRYARFAEFVRGPRAVLQYLHDMLQGRPVHTMGHNPLGALSIVAVLLITLALGASGWAVYDANAREWVAELHEVLGNGLLLVAGLHVAGVLLSSRLHRENLVRAMLTGYKRATPQAGIASAWWPLAGVLLAAVVGFWVLQWQSAGL